MSLSRWKELAERRSKAGKAINELYDNITEQKIRSKTTDAAIAKTFRLDKLDKLDQIAEQTKPRQRRRFAAPRINPDENIDYAPEVDPYEDMDVEGLLNLEDYIAPQAEKQIAKVPQYEIDPSFWQISDDPPPPYEEIPTLEEIPALEAPTEDESVDESGENRILDQLQLPNYNDLEKRLAEPEMNTQRKINYLHKVYEEANKEMRSISVRKTYAKNKFNKGEIRAEAMQKIYDDVETVQKPIKKLKSKVEQEYKKITGLKYKPPVKVKKGRGVVFYNKPQELLQKLAIILAEMEAGNTSIEMRNMGQNILDTLLRNKNLNKNKYGKIVKKYFSI